MKQSEKKVKAFMNVTSARNIAEAIVRECAEYSTTAASYARSIQSRCEEALKYLK